MAFNSFYINVLIRVILFGITNLGFFYLLMAKERFFSMVFLGILIVVQIFLLIRYVNTTNRNLARFLLTIGEEDTSFISLKEKVEKTFRGLHYSFKRLNEELSQMRLEKEYNAIRIEKVVNHLTTGILVWNDSGEIEMVNETTLLLLGMKEIKRMEELDRLQEGLQAKISGIEPGKKAVIHFTNPWGEKQNLLFRSTQILLGKSRLHIVSLQDIKAELEEQEIEAWQKLIRVLIHEVSNSVTPITTLGTNIKNRISSFASTLDKEDEAHSNLLKDIRRSGELIEQRGAGLLEFIQQYKSFIRLPEPRKTNVEINLLLNNVCALCTSMIKSSSIDLKYQRVSENLLIHIDRKMIEQVLINLIQNAIEAISEKADGEIVLSARTVHNAFEIDVKDNGEGIPEEVLDKVFIPFFTTKEKGTGIGLSLCRRILQLHGGTIKISSIVTKGTTVVMSFPK